MCGYFNEKLHFNHNFFKPIYSVVPDEAQF